LCVDELSGKNVLNEKTIPADVFPAKIEPKGNYAVAMVWSDGHKSSIYPYATLLSDSIPSAEDKGK
jgi:ATP-binding protein involved in chromosome partitioning